MTVPLPRLLIDPAEQHGVAAFSRDLAAAVSAVLGRDLGVALATLKDADAATRVHAQFTDRLWGASPEQAAEAFERFAARFPVTVTLHDLPQRSDGERNLPRRSACYRRVVAAAAGVVCNSRHEALLLAEFVVAGAEPAVIPLPVDLEPAPRIRPEPDGDVAIIGFVYPGKGHAEVVAALAALAELTGTATAPARLVALGRASAGHEDELAALIADAAARGVEVSATGYLDAATLLERCRGTAVPVAAHQHVSASGSIATWIAGGRRPLVPDTRYSREMAALRPGTLTLYGSGLLPDAIEAARRDPASTWLGADAVTGPDNEAVARAYLAWWESR